jgi:hypothetical protein
MFVVGGPSNKEVKDTLHEKYLFMVEDTQKRENILRPIFDLLQKIERVSNFSVGTHLVFKNHSVIKANTEWDYDKVRYIFYQYVDKRKKRIQTGKDLDFSFSYFCRDGTYVLLEGSIINLKNVYLIQETLDELGVFLKKQVEKIKYATDKKRAESNLLLEKASFTINT